MPCTMPFPQFPQQEKATLPKHITHRPNVNTIHVTVYTVCVVCQTIMTQTWSNAKELRMVPLLGIKKREIFQKCGRVAIAHCND